MDDHEATNMDENVAVEEVAEGFGNDIVGETLLIRKVTGHDAQTRGIGNRHREKAQGQKTVGRTEGKDRGKNTEWKKSGGWLRMVVSLRRYDAESEVLRATEDILGDSKTQLLIH